MQRVTKMKLTIAVIPKSRFRRRMRNGHKRCCAGAAGANLFPARQESEKTLLNPAWRERYETAIEAAQQAGRLALRYFDGEFRVEWKQDRSPVTVADREAEVLLRTRLLGAFPGDGFLGEESGDVVGSSGFRWIIDPIDGTRNFVRGIPIWGTLVGLEYNGEQI